MNQPNDQKGPFRQILTRLADSGGKSNKASRTHWITLSISFLLAVVLWFIVALNKQDYETWFNVPVKLVNFPEKYQLTQPFPSSIISIIPPATTTPHFPLSPQY